MKKKHLKSFAATQRSRKNERTMGEFYAEEIGEGNLNIDFSAERIAVEKLRDDLCGALLEEKAKIFKDGPLEEMNVRSTPGRDHWVVHGDPYEGRNPTLDLATGHSSLTSLCRTAEGRKSIVKDLLSGKNVDFADVCGDELGLDRCVDYPDLGLTKPVKDE